LVCSIFKIYRVVLYVIFMRMDLVFTAEQMKDFVENYPAFRQLQTNACKHMTVASELHRIIENRQLLEVTEMEQELASVHDHDAAVQKVV
jgi:hypothetical protein